MKKEIDAHGVHVEYEVYVEGGGFKCRGMAHNIGQAFGATIFNTEQLLFAGDFDLTDMDRGLLAVLLCAVRDGAVGAR